MWTIIGFSLFGLAICAFFVERSKYAEAMEGWRVCVRTTEALRESSFRSIQERNRELVLAAAELTRVQSECDEALRKLAEVPKEATEAPVPKVNVSKSKRKMW